MADGVVIRNHLASSATAGSIRRGVDITALEPFASSQLATRDLLDHAGNASKQGLAARPNFPS
jgi:hypothetical protein